MNKLALGVISIATLTTPIAANAQLASQQTTFSGNVPAICRVADLVNPTSTMTFQNDVLSGTSNDFSFVSNGNVALQLKSIEVVGAPSGSSSYNWTAGLKVNNGAELATSSLTAPSSPVPFVNGLTANDDFQMTLSISAPGNEILAQGNYIAKVTTDCIVN